MQDLMQTIDTSDKVFHDGNPAIGELGTIVPAKWLNNVQGAVRNLQSELLTVLNSAELASDPLKQDQLKQAIAKVYAPLDSPALTGTPTAPTAARFDASKNVATTEFVQSAIGSSNAIYALNTTQVLPASYAGSTIGITAGGITLTLPAVADLPNGAKFSFVSTTASSAATLACKSGESIIFASGVQKTSLSVGTGDSIELVKFGSCWVAVDGTLQAGTSASFGALLATNGYQKLPNGLLMQWLTLSGSYNSSGIFMRVPFSWPKPFSAKPFCVAASLETGITATVYVNSSIEGRTATGATWIYSAGAAGITPIVSMFALGLS